MRGASGRTVRGGGAAVRRALASWATPVHGVVAAVGAAGVLLALGTLVTSPGAQDGPVLSVGWLHGAWVPLLLGLLTCAAEIVAVRFRHDDEVEELTLLDPAVLLNALLLGPRQALFVSLAGLVLAYVIRRRAVLKAAFNLGTYAAGTSVLLLLLRGTAGDSGQVDLRLVAAMVLGAVGFVAVNGLSLSVLFSAMGAGRPLDLVREDLRLSALTVVGSVGLAATTVSMVAHTPVVLPFAALPSAALTYAYRATVTEAEERQRSSRVLAFSEVLASSPGRFAVVSAFLRLVREAFTADEVLAVFDDGDVLVLTDRGGGEPRALEMTDEHRALSRLAAAGAAVLDTEHLPSGWRAAMVAPLDGSGELIGAVVVGRRTRGRWGARDLTILSPMASALAVAMSSARHLARLVEETSKLRAVVSQSSDGILVLDGKGVVHLWNPALVRLSGHEEEDALGRPLGALLDTRDAAGNPVDAFEEGHRRLSPRTPQVAVDLELVRPDGERRSVRCAHAATFDEQRLVRDVVNVHDLTRERQVERLKSDFVATVSHELRTPVTPIKGYADLLRRRGDSMSPEKRAKALSVISDRAAHLTRLIEDLLVASRISGDQEPVRSMVIESAELPALAARAVEDFGEAAARMQVTATDVVRVACDSTRVIQVLTNLLSNALKYSPEGSPVELLVGSGDGQGHVTVRDGGRGIPEGELERIFEKFHRVEDPMVMSTSGTGIGLYIARHLARGMGGELTAASVLGRGSEFVLSLPLAGAEGPDPAGG